MLVSLIEYLSIFVVSFLGNATIIFPAPSMIFIFVAASKLNPLLVALFAGFGSSLGEVVGYLAGYGGNYLIEKKSKKLKKEVQKIEKLFNKYGGFLVIVVFAATPLPDDVLGIFSGMIKYPLKKFFIASSIGKIILNLLIAYGGAYSINLLSNFL